MEGSQAFASGADMVSVPRANRLRLPLVSVLQSGAHVSMLRAKLAYAPRLGARSDEFVRRRCRSSGIPGAAISQPERFVQKRTYLHGAGGSVVVAIAASRIESSGKLWKRLGRGALP